MSFSFPNQTTPDYTMFLFFCSSPNSLPHHDQCSVLCAHTCPVMRSLVIWRALQRLRNSNLHSPQFYTGKFTICYWLQFSSIHQQVLVSVIYSLKSFANIFNHREKFFFRYYLSSAVCMYVCGCVCVCVSLRLQPHRST